MDLDTYIKEMGVKEEKAPECIHCEEPFIPGQFICAGCWELLPSMLSGAQKYVLRRYCRALAGHEVYRILCRIASLHADETDY